MKLSMERDALGHLLDVVVGLVPSRSSLPILTNVLVEASKETQTVRLTATDLDVSIALASAATVTDGGAVAVPGKLFNEVVRAGRGEVSITSSDHRVEVKSPGREFWLMGMDPAEFPRVPAAEGATVFEIPADVLPELISRTSYAVSRDETRPALNGVLWEVGPKELRMVATDGHRLAFYKIAGEYAVKQERQVIVPPKSLQQLTRLLRERGGETVLKVEVTDSSIRWRMGESVIFSKLIEGPFPKYEQVIPKDNNKRLVIDREAFIQDLRAADAVTDQTSHMVKLSLKNGDVRLFAQSADIGGSEVACEGAVYEGEALMVGYNAQYVLDALGHMTSPRAEVLLKTPTGPVLMCEVSEKPGAGDYLCLVMPLRLPE